MKLFKDSEPLRPWGLLYLRKILIPYTDMQTPNVKSSKFCVPVVTNYFGPSQGDQCYFPIQQVRMNSEPTNIWISTMVVHKKEEQGVERRIDLG